MAKTINKQVYIWLNQQGIENNLKSIKAAIAKTANELNKLPIESEEWLKKSEKLAKLKSIYSDVRKEISATTGELNEATKSIRDQLMAYGGLATIVQTASSALRRFVSATQEYVDAYATLDDAMTNVSKYTGLTREEVKQLNEEFRQMDTRTPTEKLNALAADAGRLGITSKEAIKDFVEAADIINIALGEDLGEDAVKNIGKMAQMFGETETMGLRGAMIATASAVNTLAQSSSASEPYIMEVASRLAGVANTAGITQAQIMGIASALDQNMAGAEKAATSVQKIMMDMMGNTAKYADLVGMTAEEFRTLVDSDMNAAFVTVLDKLKEIRDTGGKSAFAETLADLKLKGSGLQETLMTLAGNTDQLRQAQELATQAYADGTSVINEAAAVNGNAAAQLDIAKKAVQDAKAALGEELIPVITDLTKASASGIQTTADIVKWALQHKAVVGALVAQYLAYIAIKNKAQIVEMKNQALEKVSTTLNTLSARSSAKKTAAIASATAATEAKRLAEMKARLATLSGIAADNQMRAVLVQETVAKAANTAATEAQAKAEATLAAAKKATPWGAVIAAIGLATIGISKLIDKHREAKKAAEEFNTEVAKEQAEAQYLFEKLKNTEKGTDDYREALEKLKEKYPEIIQKHLDEEGALRDVEQAYKDVIVQIKAKIAEQLKEQQSNEAISKNITEQADAMDKIREKLRKQGKSESEVADIASTIQNMAVSGSTASDIRKKLKETYGLETKNGTQFGYLWDIGRQIDKMTESQTKMNAALESADERFNPFIEDGKKAADEIQQLDDEIRTLQQSMRAAEDKEPFKNQIKALQERKKLLEESKKAQEQSVSDGNAGGSGNGNDPGGSSNKSKKDPVTDFEKRLQEFRARQQRETMDGWEKTKQTVIDSYQSWIDEATKIYGEGSDKVEALTIERDQAIAAAGQQYVQKYGKTLEDFSQKMKDWAKEAAPDGGNEMVDAVLGTQAKWQQRTNEALNQLNELMNLRDMMVADNMDTTALDSVIDKLELSIGDMPDLEAQDIQKTLEKYQKDIDTFITNEQKDITNATLTETERQKQAIREKYELEIQLIEKLKAARKAQDGEDADVSDLEAKIKEMKELLDKQLSNVDTQAAKSANKSVWQQLAEFDWSKMRENWQQGLDLMTQGLQEFANVAFDIYGSILQIQNNATEAELQKTQEAYDAKSAALKKQLDNGLISQKRYDAQMEQLQKEKEKKEKKLKHDAYERERAANLTQGAVNLALTISSIYAKEPGGLAIKSAAAAIAAAVQAVQIAAIASQPNPYAKGGYIRGRQYAVMGEQGDEWVASNKLLRDKEASAVIAALDEYQRGNRVALAAITVPAPDLKNVSQAVSQNGRTFAPSNQTTNNYYQSSENSELLKEIRQMNEYLRDPKNRRAWISREIQLEFDEQEKEIRETARL